ncbi:MAG: hypothetical protein ACLQK4_07915 [Acidimicrobiales bacterium]|jgi:hypothetical protein
MNDEFDDNLESEVVALLRRTAAVAEDAPWDVHAEDFKHRRSGIRHSTRNARRLAVLLTIAAVTIAAVVVPLSLKNSNVKSSRPTSSTAVSGRTPRPGVVDTAATPKGWSPVDFQDVQISVPNSWSVENSGTVCAGDGVKGTVFLGEPISISSGVSCKLVPNAISMEPLESAIGTYRTAIVNGISVDVEQAAGVFRQPYAEWVLGVELTARGPMAKAVLQTLTISPYLVVMRSRDVRAPKSWREITFGGIQFAAPRSWRERSDDVWGGCGYGISPDTVTLDTATQSGANEVCPGVPAMARVEAAHAGVVIGSGRYAVLGSTRHWTCMFPKDFSYCIDPSSDSGGLLTLAVELPTVRRPVVAEIGLAGSGDIAAAILDSIRVVPTRSYPWTAVNCGRAFFSAADLAALKTQFGRWSCQGFKSISELVWVVIGSGGFAMYEDGAEHVTSYPGGSMAAVLTCPLTDAACVAPDEDHAFADFSVYPSPDSTTFVEESTPGMGAPLLALQNGSCSQDVFDPVSRAWYSSRGMALLTNPYSPGGTLLPSPPEESGAIALTSPAPTPTDTSCYVATTASTSTVP